MERTFLRSNTASRVSSARTLRLSFGSWSSCLRMYSQSFLVNSVRGSGSLPTTAASAVSGCTGLLRALLAGAAFFGIGIGQLERARLGSQAKNQPCLSGSLRGAPAAGGAEIYSKRAFKRVFPVIFARVLLAPPAGNIGLSTFAPVAPPPHPPAPPPPAPPPT